MENDEQKMHKYKKWVKKAEQEYNFKYKKYMDSKRLWSRTYVEVPMQPHIRRQLETPLLSLFDDVVKAEQKMNFLNMKFLYYDAKSQVLLSKDLKSYHHKNYCFFLKYSLSLQKKMKSI